MRHKLPASARFTLYDSSNVVISFGLNFCH